MNSMEAEFNAINMNNNKHVTKTYLPGAYSYTYRKDPRMIEVLVFHYLLVLCQFCIKAVMGSVDLPYKEGLKQEGELARVLFSSGQAKAQQYAFFSQRAATKVL